MWGKAINMTKDFQSQAIKRGKKATIVKVILVMLGTVKHQ